MNRFLMYLLVIGAIIPTATALANGFLPRISDGIGVTEWEEWSFADVSWWAATAGNQDRNQFRDGLASGVVAIADPDEWDDIADAADLGPMNTQLISLAIALTGTSNPLLANRLGLKFASSWRDEDTQEVSIEVSYDGAAPIEVLRWSSDPANPNFHDDAPNEFVEIGLSNPEGANEAVLMFNMFNATNDWWWALDNIEVWAPTGPRESPETLFYEDFESLAPTLGPNIDEALAGDHVFAQAPPTGWTINTDDYTSPLGGKGTPGITRIPEPSSVAIAILVGLALSAVAMRKQLR